VTSTVLNVPIFSLFLRGFLLSCVVDKFFLPSIKRDGLFTFFFFYFAPSVPIGIFCSPLVCSEFHLLFPGGPFVFSCVVAMNLVIAGFAAGLSSPKNLAPPASRLVKSQGPFELNPPVRIFLSDWPAIFSTFPASSLE